MTGEGRWGEPDYVGVDQAHGDVGTVVTGTDPRVATGQGHMFNDVGVVIVSEHAGTERRHQARPLSHSSEQREYLRKRFVDPPGFDKAQRCLESSSAVFISGPPGSGRRTAAMMLLWRRFPGTDASFRWLTLDDDDGGRPLDPESVQQGEILLLDLSQEDDDEKFATVRYWLETFRASVERNGAALVVVLPDDPDRRLGEEFTRPRVELGRPPGHEVLRKHLVEGRVPFDEQALAALGEYSATAAMRDLTLLAERIVEAYDKSPNVGFAQWRQRATETITNYSQDVADQVNGCEPGQRAMLLASSMVEGAHADSAYAAREKLLATLGFPEDDRHVLEREGLDDALRSVDVELTASRRIKFTRLHYADAVRGYFWTNYPELRDALRDWVEECVSLTELTDTDRDRVLSRFAGQACRTGRVADLWTLADRWTRREGDGLRSHTAGRLAASALAYGLRDGTNAGRSAREMRRKIYEWAVSAGLRPGLARVLVLVCASVMADVHPEQALFRLRWLAAHQSDDVAEAARSEIRKLADDNSFYRRFLWRMEGWLKQPRRSDVELFVALAVPQRLLARGTRHYALIGNRSVRKQLTACWRVVLTYDDSFWRASVLDWFDAALPGRDEEQLLDVLVEATDGRLPQLGRLYVLARDWAHSAQVPDERQARQAVFRALVVRLDLAQKDRLDSRRRTC